MAAAAEQTFSLVESPPAAPPDSGLIASLSGQFLIDDDGQAVSGSPSPNRWEVGFQYNPEQTCYSVDVQDPCAVGTMTAPSNPPFVKCIPWLCWAGDTCSPFGWSARDYQGRARRALLATESKQIAHELWTGKRARASGWPNAYLASSSALVLSTSPQTPANGLAMLEQGLADTSNGGRGMVHVTRQLGLALSQLGNVFRSLNGLIVTYTGTVIVADAGYPGTGPGGIPATQTQWAFATQMVTVRRSAVQVIPDNFMEATRRDTNLIEWRAERLAAATFPPCTLVACEFALPVPTGMAS